MGTSEKWRALLLVGPPGCGKGTQGAALGGMPGYLHVASGEIFRRLDRSSDLGRQVESITSQGKLVPDELTIEIWREHMEELRRTGVFRPHRQIVLSDGIPRTVRQAELLADRWDVLRVFVLELENEEEAVQRILHRALEQDRTDDADESVIRGRLRTYQEETAAVLSFYDPALVVRINGSARPMQVLRDLADAVCRSPAETDPHPEPLPNRARSTNCRQRRKTRG